MVSVTTTEAKSTTSLLQLNNLIISKTKKMQIVLICILIASISSAIAETSQLLSQPRFCPETCTLHLSATSQCNSSASFCNVQLCGLNMYKCTINPQLISRPLPRPERGPLRLLFPRIRCGTSLHNTSFSRCVKFSTSTGSYLGYEFHSLQSISAAVPLIKCSIPLAWRSWRRDLSECMRKQLRRCSSFGTSSCSVTATILKCCPFCRVIKNSKEG